jgi:hypothetical protein
MKVLGFVHLNLMLGWDEQSSKPNKWEDRVLVTVL